MYMLVSDFLKKIAVLMEAEKDISHKDPITNNPLLKELAINTEEQINSGEINNDDSVEKNIEKRENRGPYKKQFIPQNKLVEHTKVKTERPHKKAPRRAPGLNKNDYSDYHRNDMKQRRQDDINYGKNPVKKIKEKTNV